ncbi:MAG TPA: IS21 family transposase [Gemmatimonadales bacterium]|nr:IS21 family transposase [Gemmatimonadales bacterium]
MRNIRDVLRLTAAGMSSRKIAASLSIGASTVIDCLHRARRAGLAWPLPDEIDDAILELRLYPPRLTTREQRPLPNWAEIHRELKRPGVTLELLWQEYREQHPSGYAYSRFCDLHRAWEKSVSPTMRQTHIAGERMFVDYSGTKLQLIERTTGEVLTAELFVAVLGASNFTYAEATWTQSLPDWIGSHTRAFSYFRGVSAMVVSDNLKSGITKACFYEPNVNRTYREMAKHYDTAIVPARPNKPKDKAKVEVGVQVAKRWIIAKLRKRKFFTLAELNAAIRECVEQINKRVTRHLGASRRSLFEEIERSALKKLPDTEYVFAQWKQCRAGIDYHVEIDKHYYSVPYTLVRQELWASYTASMVEVFHRGKRVAVHRRGPPNRGHTTLPEHMPSSHRRHADWTPARIMREAAEIGPNASTLVEVIMRERRHPEQGFRSCRGIVKLVGRFPRERVEAACERALAIGTRSFSSVKSILDTKLDRKRPEKAADGPAIVHSNIRGPTFYH